MENLVVSLINEIINGLNYDLVKEVMTLESCEGLNLIKKARWPLFEHVVF